MLSLMGGVVAFFNKKCLMFVNLKVFRRMGVDFDEYKMKFSPVTFSFIQ